MRSAGNFHPDWGYLAPMPSFMRTARIVAVATAIGATGGAAVVLSLVERPAGDAGKTSIAAHALVTSVQAATPPAIPLAAATSVAPITAPPQVQASAPAQPAPPMEAQAPAQAQPAIASQETTPQPAISQSAGVSEASVTPTQEAPASVAATEISPAPATEDATVESDAALAQKKAAKKHHTAEYDTPKRRSKSADRGLGPILRRIFSARNTGRSF